MKINIIKPLRKSAEFILSNLRNNDGSLLHRYRGGESGIISNLDDYAFFIQALIDLYETEFDFKYLKVAIEAK